MVSFFIHKLTVYCWTQHCRKIRTNMSTCWAMSVQLQDIVTRRRRICLTLAYCCLIKWPSFVSYEILFLSRAFSLCSPCGSAISLKFKFSQIKKFLWNSKYTSLYYSIMLLNGLFHGFHHFYTLIVLFVMMGFTESFFLFNLVRLTEKIGI